MAYVLDPGAVLGAASGLAMAGLGAAVLRLRPWKPSGLAFSAFAVLWGLQVLAANLGQMAADPATALPWALLFTLLLLPLPVPLLYFVSAYPRPAAWLRNPAALAALAAPGVLLMLLFAAAPRLFVEGMAVNPQGLPSTVWGPLFQPVQLANSVLAFVAALAIASARLWRARGVAASQLALVTAALLAYTAHRAASVLDTGLLGAEGWAAQLGPEAYALRLLSLLAALGMVGFVGSRALARPTLPWRPLLLASAGLPLASGFLEAGLAAAGVVGFQSIGAWRLAMVALFAYAIARYRLFDIELRLTLVAPAAAHLVASMFGLDLLWSFAWTSFNQEPLLGLVASLGLAGALAPVVRHARRWVRRAAPHVGEEAYQQKRKLDVYLAALGEARADGRVDPREAAFLAELRATLGISAEQHAALVRKAGRGSPAG